MENKYESAIKVVCNGVSQIFDKLADMSNFGGVMPPEKVSNWTADADTCRFTIDGMGEMGLRIVERETDKLVKYTADGQTRVNFFLWVQMMGVAESESRIKVTLKADLNPMMKMVVGKHMQKLVDTIADAIAKYQY